MSTETLSNVWLVYKTYQFIGYSSSLGEGKESRELIKVFTTESKAENFVEKNRDKYLADDTNLTIEKSIVDDETAPSSTSMEEIGNFFQARR